MAHYYNLSAIRQLLSEALTDEDINTLCFDYFRPVYDQLAVGMSKGAKIQILLEYCERQSRITELLDTIKEMNPSKYSQYASRLQEAGIGVVNDLPVSSSKATRLSTLKHQLAMAERVLNVLKERVAGYSELNVPLELAVNLDEQQEKVANLRQQITDLERS